MVYLRYSATSCYQSCERGHKPFNYVIQTDCNGDYKYDDCEVKQRDYKIGFGMDSHKDYFFN